MVAIRAENAPERDTITNYNVTFGKNDHFEHGDSARFFFSFPRIAGAFAPLLRQRNRVIDPASLHSYARSSVAARRGAPRRGDVCSARILVADEAAACSVNPRK